MPPRRATGRTSSRRCSLRAMTLPEAALPLAEWESFYVIIGTSAAALTGLMFVVIAVVADAGPRAATPQGIATFVTPTIFHFCAALMISAIVSAPWPRHLELRDRVGTGGVGRLHLFDFHPALGRQHQQRHRLQDGVRRLDVARRVPAARLRRDRGSRAATGELEPSSRYSWSAAPRSCWCSSASTMPGTP